MMAKGRLPLRARSGRFQRNLMAAAVATALGLPAAGLANPTKPTVVSGSASFSTVGSTLSVANSPNAIINWQSFSIAAPETTRFVQQSAASAVLNRVTGADASQILGVLQSNGRVFLINPAGVFFGAGARIDVAGLAASTLNLSDQDFLAGRLNFQAGAIAGSVVNQGRIATPLGGSVILVGSSVENSGVITAPDGRVILAAGSSVLLGDTGAPNVLVQVQATNEQALNLGSIAVGRGEAGIYAGLVKQSGIVTANSATVDAGGRIVFRATKELLVGGASLTSATGGTGGRIELLGEHVGVIDQAVVDASGATAGGTILVGGDYQGKNAEVPNARAVFTGVGTLIRADASEAGDGGRVILWSDEATRAYGRISARGADGGSGGFVETSSKGYLDVTRAPEIGVGGTWLLDPSNITVQSGTGTLDGATPTFTANADDSTVSASVINTALDGGTSVTLDTGNPSGTQSGDITINAAITKSTTASVSLTLQADGGIFVNAPITDASAAPNLGVNLYSGRTNGGAIQLAAPVVAGYVYLSANNGAIVDAYTGAGPTITALNLDAYTSCSGCAAPTGIGSAASPLKTKLDSLSTYVGGTPLVGSDTWIDNKNDAGRSLTVYGMNGATSDIHLVNNTNIVLPASEGVLIRTTGGNVSIESTGGGLIGPITFYGFELISTAGDGLAYPSASGGSITLKAKDDIDLANGWLDASADRYYAGLDGTAGNGGTVSLTATNGFVAVKQIDSLGGSGYLSANGNGGKGGSVTLAAAGNVALASANVRGGDAYTGETSAGSMGGDGGSVTITSGGIVTIGSYYASPPSISWTGGINADGGEGATSYSIYDGGTWTGGQGGKGGDGGSITITGSGASGLNIQMGGYPALSAKGANAGNAFYDGTYTFNYIANGGKGGAGGKIELWATSGPLKLDTTGGLGVYPTVPTGVYPVTTQLNVPGGLGRSGLANGAGGAGGIVTISAPAGGIDLAYASIAAAAGSGGSDGTVSRIVDGALTGTGGKVTIGAGGTLAIGTIDVPGSSNYDQLPGGRGGTVEITSTGAAVLGAMYAYGGQGADGGMGGSVVIDAGGPVSVSGSISAYGASSYGGTIASGGAGGTVSVTSGGDVSISSIDASGGAGGTRADGYGGPGGAGGSITIVGTGPGMLLDSTELYAQGGGGGSAGFYYNGTDYIYYPGGAGGAGGSIDVHTTNGGTLGLYTTASTIRADGGNGGYGGDGVTPPIVYGAGGNGGTVSIAAPDGVSGPGGVYVNAINIEAAGGSGGTTGANGTAQITAGSNGVWQDSGSWWMESDVPLRVDSLGSVLFNGSVANNSFVGLYGSSGGDFIVKNNNNYIFDLVLGGPNPGDTLSAVGSINIDSPLYGDIRLTRQISAPTVILRAGSGAILNRKDTGDTAPNISATDLTLTAFGRGGIGADRPIETADVQNLTARSWGPVASPGSPPEVPPQIGSDVRIANKNGVAGPSITIQEVRANTSNIEIVNDTDVVLTGCGECYTLYTTGGNVSVQSLNGSIVSDGSGPIISSIGGSYFYSDRPTGRGGDVTLLAAQNIDLYDASIEASGSSYYAGADNKAGDGGNVTLTAAGGSVDVGFVASTGGTGSIYPTAGYGGDGGRGGDVAITAGGGAVSVGSIDVYGGSSNGGTSAAGGAGGNVTINSAAEVRIGRWDGTSWFGTGIDARGGTGGTTATFGGVGGAGGAILIQGSGAIVNVTSPLSIYTSGGPGGNAAGTTGAYLGDGGAGGNAGNIEFRAGQGGELSGAFGSSIVANGGNGGLGFTSGLYVDGNGGNAGTVKLYSPDGLNGPGNILVGSSLLDGSYGGLWVSALGGTGNATGLTGLVQLHAGSGGINNLIDPGAQLTSNVPVEIVSGGPVLLGNLANAVPMIFGSAAGDLFLRNSASIDLGDAADTSRFVDTTGSVDVRVPHGTAAANEIRVKQPVSAGGNVTFAGDALVIDPTYGSITTGGAAANFFAWLPQSTAAFIFDSADQWLFDSISTPLLRVGAPDFSTPVSVEFGLNPTGPNAPINFNTIGGLSIFTTGNVVQNPGAALILNTGTMALQASAASVSLTDTGNSFAVLAGRATAPSPTPGAFNVVNNGSFSVGTIDGVFGVGAQPTGAVNLTAIGGAIHIASPLTVNGPWSFDAPLDTTNNAQVDFASGSLTLASGTLINAGTLNAQSASSTISGPVSTTGTSVIRLQPATNLTFASGFTSTGIIELVGDNSLPAPLLRVTAGALVNNGTLRSAGGYNGVGNNGILLLDSTAGTGSLFSGSGTVQVDQLLGIYSTSGVIDLSSHTLNFAPAMKLFLSSPGGGAGATTRLGSGTVFGTASGDIGSAGDVLDIASDVTLPAGWTLGLGGATRAVTVSGAGTLTNSGAMKLDGDTVDVAFVNDGSLDINASATISGAVSTTAASVVTVTPQQTLTVANGFTNSGTLKMTRDAGGASAIAVSAGTLVNASGGSIVSGGSGGAGTGTGTNALQLGGIGTALDNRGTIAVNHPMRIDNASGSVVLNGGTANGLLDMTAGKPLDVSGAVDWKGGTLAGTGVLTIGGGLTISAGGVKILDGLAVSTASLTLPAGDRLDILSGALGVGGNISNSGTLNLNGGTLDQAAGAFATLSGGTSNFNGGAYTRPAGTVFDNSGAVSLNAGTLALDGGGTGAGAYNTAAGATFALGGTGTTYAIGSIGNAGTFNVAGGTANVASLSGAGAFSVTGGTANVTSANLTGATTVNGASAVLSLGGGTLNGVTVGTTAGSQLNIGGNTAVSGALTNDATVNVNSGTLALTGGGTGAGAYGVASGATLALGGTSATYTIGSIADDGNLNVTGGTANVGAVTGTGAANVTGGILNVPSYNRGGVTTVNGGTFNVAGNATNSGTLGIVLGSMSVGGQTINNGTATLSGGTLSLSASGLANNSGATLNLNGGAFSSPAGTPFGNAGTVNVNAGGLVLDGGDGGTGGGTYNIASGAGLAFSAGSYTVANIANSGTLNFQGGTVNLSGGLNTLAGGTTTLNSAYLAIQPASLFGNAGTVNVNGGTLDLNAGDGGTSGGAYAIAAGSTLKLTAGSYGIGNLTGAGRFEVAGGTASVTNASLTGTPNGAFLSAGALNVLGTASLASLEHTGGVLGGGGTGNLTVARYVLNNPSGTGTIGSGFASLSLTSPGDLTIKGFNVTSTGTLLLDATAGGLSIDGATVSGGNMTLAGNFVQLKSSSTTPSLATASGNMTVSAPTILKLDGATGAAKLTAAGAMTINAGDVDVIAGAAAASIDPTTLGLTATGNLVLAGGSATGASADITGGAVNVSATNVALLGGSGANAGAGIKATTGNLTLNATGQFILAAGTGANADAALVAPAGAVSATVDTCTGCAILAVDPATTSSADAGAYALSGVTIVEFTPPVQTVHVEPAITQPIVDLPVLVIKENTPKKPPEEAEPAPKPKPEAKPDGEGEKPSGEPSAKKKRKVCTG